MTSARSYVVLALVFGFSLQASTSFAQTKKIKDTPTSVTAPTEAPEVKGPFKISGFLEAQGLLTNRKDYTLRGFTLNDAALYISKDFSGGLSAFVDLPFATPAGSRTNTTAFGDKQAQAYFLYTDSEFAIHFGQFDSIFGVEQNDSKDRFFADAGAIQSFIIPRTHSGVLAAYKMDSLTFRAIFANPNTQGTMADSNPAVGAQMIYGERTGSPRFAAGMMMSEESVPHSQKQHLLVDVVGGAQVKQVKIDVSYNHKKTAGQDKTANGFGIFGVYDHGTRTNWGARFEYANDVADVAGTPLPTLISNFTTFAFGPSYKFSDDVILRGDVQFGNFDFPSPTEDQNLMGASVSVLATL